MKENTFDVPAFKFFLIKVNDNKALHTRKEYENSLNNRNFYMIPFENIDGLRVEEACDLLGINDFLLIGTMYYKSSNNFLYSVANTLKYSEDMGICSFRGIYLDECFLKTRLKKRIDKIFEELMERDYMISDEYTKRIYRCFFERYQDGSFQKTKERVKKLEIENNG